MAQYTDLDKRMKGYYETVPKIKLMRRCPVIIRLDGKAFHSFTKGFERPFDDLLIKTMQMTAKYLCQNIQGCVLGYTQSDEISLLLVDYQTLQSDAWFDYEVQKMCSVPASMATMAFNRFFNQNLEDWGYEKLPDWTCGDKNESSDEELWEQARVYCRAKEKGAMFDSRCFNIPKEEVTNYFYW